PVSTAGASPSTSFSAELGSRASPSSRQRTCPGRWRTSGSWWRACRSPSEPRPGVGWLGPMTDLRPLREAELSGVQAVFSDVDGTLTTASSVRSSTLAAVERLRESGVRVVLVTGRPSGFAEAWLRTWPVDAVVAENGGLALCRGARGRLPKDYAPPATRRRADRRQLERVVRAALRFEPRARLSTDSRFAEVDLAVDYAEEVHLGAAAATRLEAFFARHRVNAVRSSVHVNAWVDGFDKAWMVRRF